MTDHSHIGIKQARFIVATHYGLDPKIAARKLLKHINADNYVPGEQRTRENKVVVIVEEAKRIEALREKTGISQDLCHLCGRHDGPKRIKCRDDLNTKTPKWLVKRGWKPISIEGPMLCNSCWRLAAIDVHQYRFLISLQRLCNQLEKIRHVRHQNDTGSTDNAA